MHIRGGFGKRAVEANIREYMDFGYSKADAEKFSKKVARKFFIKKFGSDRELPEYLRGED